MSRYPPSTLLPLFAKFYPGVHSHKVDEGTVFQTAVFCGKDNEVVVLVGGEADSSIQ